MPIQMTIFLFSYSDRAVSCVFFADMPYRADISVCSCARWYGNGGACSQVFPW